MILQCGLFLIGLYVIGWMKIIQVIYPYIDAEDVEGSIFNLPLEIIEIVRSIFALNSIVGLTAIAFMIASVIL